MIQNKSVELGSTAHKVTVIYYSQFYICLSEILLMFLLHFVIGPG